MKIRFYCITKNGMIYDDHELELGRHNEYYLPAIQPNAEAWIIVTDAEGTETKLKLKR